MRVIIVPIPRVESADTLHLQYLSIAPRLLFPNTFVDLFQFLPEFILCYSKHFVCFIFLNKSINVCTHWIQLASLSFFFGCFCVFVQLCLMLLKSHIFCFIIHSNILCQQFLVLYILYIIHAIESACFLGQNQQILFQIFFSFY